MKKQLLLIATALFAVGCTQKSDYECQFTLNGETHLTFNFTNVDKPKSFILSYEQSFPHDQYLYSFSVEHDTTIDYTLPLNHPTEAVIQNRTDRKEFFVFLVQNEPLTINYDIAKGKFSFKGFSKQVCEYITNHPSALSVDQFTNGFAIINKAYQQKQKDLKTAFAARKLPKWFFDLQTENLLFSKIILRLFDAASMGQLEEMLKATPIQECKYYWLRNYVDELYMYQDNEYDLINGDKHLIYEQTQDNLDVIKTHLPENIVSYYTAARLSVFLHNLRKAVSTSEYEEENKYLNKLLAANSSLIKDTALMNYIINEQQNIYNNLITQNSLNFGDKAPNFYLKNVDNKSVSLPDFAGKLVLLNFWGSHNSACIASIPKKNALVEKFGNQGFVLVNICLDNAPDEWRQIINDHHPLGEQLICKGQWEKNLREKYIISTRPHYVLVDRNGLIIANHVKGDSLEVYIERNIGNK